MISVINEAIEAVIGMMNADGQFARVTRGALPTGGGIVCEMSVSAPSAMHMDKNTVAPLDLVLNGKSTSLAKLSDALNDIHSRLTRATSYPSGERWQITDIATTTFPQVIARESDNTWIMASAISVTIYQRGE